MWEQFQRDGHTLAWLYELYLILLILNVNPMLILQLSLYILSLYNMVNSMSLQAGLSPKKIEQTHGKKTGTSPNFSGSFSWIHHVFKMFFMTRWVNLRIFSVFGFKMFTGPLGDPLCTAKTEKNLGPSGMTPSVICRIKRSFWASEVESMVTPRDGGDDHHISRWRSNNPNEI